MNNQCQYPVAVGIITINMGNSIVSEIIPQTTATTIPIILNISVPFDLLWASTKFSFLSASRVYTCVCMLACIMCKKSKKEYKVSAKLLKELVCKMIKFSNYHKPSTLISKWLSLMYFDFEFYSHHLQA